MGQPGAVAAGIEGYDPAIAANGFGIDEMRGLLSYSKNDLADLEWMLVE
jgi:hypothetical protein